MPLQVTISGLNPIPYSRLEGALTLRYGKWWRVKVSKADGTMLTYSVFMRPDFTVIGSEVIKAHSTIPLATAKYQIVQVFTHQLDEPLHSVHAEAQIDPTPKGQ